VRAAAVVLAFGVLVLAACGGDSGPDLERSSVEWPPPDNPAELAREAGLDFLTAETLTYHVDSHLDVIVDGAAVVVPAGIGIDVDAVGVDGRCSRPCISPLHTHDDSGVLHVEAAAEGRFTLGQFFTEWDVRLDDSCVDDFCRPDTEIASYVDGEAYDGDPREIELKDEREIAVVIGEPPAEIPSSYDFSNL
jgi:hypothetical protein